MEKPLARTVEEAQAIVAVAADADVTLMVAENYRFMPPVLAARQMVERGEAGALRLVQLQEDFPFQPVEWRNDSEINGGGVLIDGGIHKASLLAYLAGNPTEVYAAQVPSAQPGLEAEDGVVAMLRYPSGLVGVINHYVERRASRLAPVGYGVGFQGRHSLRAGRQLDRHHR